MGVIVAMCLVTVVVIMIVTAAGVVMFVLVMMVITLFAVLMLVIVSALVAMIVSMVVIMIMVATVITSGIVSADGGQIEDAQDEKSDTSDEHHGTKDTVRREIGDNATTDIEIQHDSAPKQEE